MRSMLVIGLGHFGTHLALKLSELGNEVMVVDRDEEAVNKIAPQVTTALVGDCMSPEILKSLGVGNFDICFVCISDNFQSSLEITSLLKDLGARYVISKTDRDIHAKFLRRIGADEVIFPERDMAQRTAFRTSARNAFQYIELTPEYAIFEMKLPDNWSGKSVKQLDVRSRHNLNIIAVKRNEQVVPITSPDYVFAHNEHIFVVGSKQDLLKLMEKN